METNDFKVASGYRLHVKKISEVWFLMWSSPALLNIRPVWPSGDDKIIFPVDDLDQVGLFILTISLMHGVQVRITEYSDESLTAEFF